MQFLSKDPVHASPTSTPNPTPPTQPQPQVRSIWKYVHLNYASLFDWFVIAGDDTFIIPSNLRAMLLSPAIVQASSNGTHSQPMYLGRNLRTFENGNVIYHHHHHDRGVDRRQRRQLLQIPKIEGKRPSRNTERVRRHSTTIVTKA